jgi:hypothetical protein
MHNNRIARAANKPDGVAVDLDKLADELVAGAGKGIELP